MLHISAREAQPWESGTHKAAGTGGAGSSLGVLEQQDKMELLLACVPVRGAGSPLQWLSSDERGLWPPPCPWYFPSCVAVFGYLIQLPNGSFRGGWRC